LKRRVASLPPLPAETFAEKVLSAQETTNAEAAKASFSQFCQSCQRQYYSENAFQNHLGSQKHKQRLLETQDNASMISSIASYPNGAPGPPTPSEGDVTEADDIAEKLAKVSVTSGDDSSTKLTPTSSVAGSVAVGGINTSKCLFCGEISSTIYINVSHMASIHGMFIPEREYLSDLEGLIGYLSTKINDYHECLYCGRMRNSRVAILEHMRNKGHCMIGFDSEEEKIEIGQYYDFRSTYSDYDSDEETEDGVSTPQNGGGVKLGAKRDAKPVKRDDDSSDGEGEEEDEEWETDSDESSVDSDDIGPVTLENHHRLRDLSKHPHHSHDSRVHHSKDGFHSHAHSHNHAVFYSDYELHLPSGRSLGHRSLARYFRQNLRNHPQPSELAQRALTNGDDSDNEDGETQLERGRGRDRDRQIITRGNGGLGMLGVSEHKKRQVKQMEKRERKSEARHFNNVQARNEKRNNHQKHYRVSILNTLNTIEMSLVLTFDDYRINCLEQLLKRVWFTDLYFCTGGGSCWIK
jgi:pre-60S factor REI1